MSAALEITTERDDARLRIWAHRAESARLVVSFSGVGKELSGQSYDFPATATGEGRHNALFIADPARSWLNAPGLIEEMVSEIEAFSRACGAEEICFMGHSMGGYTAMILPGFTLAHRVFAFAPQFSVHPEVAGDDGRWMNYREGIGAHRIRGVTDHLNDHSDYVLVHGSQARDALQRDRFETRANMRHFIIPGLGHGVPVFLKKQGLMTPIVQAAFDGRPRQLRRLFARVGGAHRAVEPARLAPSSELTEARA